MLKKYIGKEHSVDIIALDEKKKVKDVYDIIYYAHFSLYKKLKRRGRQCTYASVTSHKCFLDIKNTIEELRNFDKVSVNSNILLKQLSKYKENIWYTPNGVDTSLFFFSDNMLHRPLTFGWVGNKDRMEKNYNLILEPLMKNRKDVKFDIIATKKSDSGFNLRTPFEMVNYYHNIDFYLVTSSTEGTPNPALESMSCGIPVISTPVGNMTDIIKNSNNGYLVYDNIGDFNTIIDKVKNITDEEYKIMKRRTRKSILSWDWENRSKKWIRFLIDHG